MAIGCVWKGLLWSVEKNVVSMETVCRFASEATIKWFEEVTGDNKEAATFLGSVSGTENMEIEPEDFSPETALEKDPFQMTVEDVYDISHVIGKDLMKISKETRGVSDTVADLQFKIVRVLEVLETLVNQSSLATEELKMERDNLKAEVERLMRESPQAALSELGPDKMIIDLADPNRPRFTLQELRDVLQERNKLKVQLLVAQDELQCYKSGIIPATEDQILTLEDESIITSSPRPNQNNKTEKSSVKGLFSFKQVKKQK